MFHIHGECGRVEIMGLFYNFLTVGAAIYRISERSMTSLVERIVQQGQSPWHETI